MTSDRSVDLRSIDPLAAPLTVVGPKAGATAGSPVESDLTIHAADGVDMGIWECTPGTWPSEKVGVGELMHFVAGHGWLVDADGRREEIRPGLVRYLPDGWRGHWEVDETVRKVYVIVRSHR